MNTRKTAGPSLLRTYVPQTIMALQVGVLLAALTSLTLGTGTAFAGGVAGGQAAAAEPLPDSKVVTASLTKGQTRLYDLRLAAGEFVLVKALQKDVNVALALLDPSNRVLADVDMEVDLSRSEFLGWTAPDPGEYRLRVTPGRFNETYGDFQIEVSARHRARDEDHHRLRAQSIVTEAQNFAKKEDAEPREARRHVTDATNRYEESLPAWQAAGDKNAQARVMIIVGENSRRLGDRLRARDMFERALTLRKEIGDRWGEGEALNDLAIIHDETGEKQRALEFHEQVLPIRREVGYVKGQIITLQNIAKTLVDLDEFQAAQKRQEEIRALLDEYKKITRGVGDPLGEAEYANKYGLIYDRLGLQQQAISWHEKALAVVRAIPDYAANPEYVAAESTYLSNVAKAYSGRGDKARARDLYQEAMKICGDGCPREKRAHMLHNLGSVSLALGDTETARASLDEALRLRGNDIHNESYTRIALGNFYFKMGEVKKAHAEFERGLKLSEMVGARHVKVAAFEGLARVGLASGDESAAAEAINKGLADVANLASRVVNPDRKASYLADTQRLYDHKLNLLMRQHARQPAAGFDSEAFALSEGAKARGLVDLLNEARVDIRVGVDPNLVRRERAALQRLSGKTEYLTALKVRRERAAAANAAADVAKLGREIAIQEQEIGVINLDLDRAQDEMRRGNTRFAELTRPRPLDVKQVQREILDGRTLLLEYRLTDERGYLFAVTAEDFNVYPIPGRAAVNDAVLSLYQSLTARSKKVDFEPADVRERRLRDEDAKFAAGAPKLSEMLLGQVTRLRNKRRLIIIADGQLQYFPFAALPAPGPEGRGGVAYLISAHEIVYLPSASALTLIRDSGSRPTPSKQLAVVADPIYQPRLVSQGINGGASREPMAGTLGFGGLPSFIGGLEPLRHARQEARSILDLVSRNDRVEFLGERATKQAASSEALAQYRFVHYAAHGRFDSESPSQSGLIFSLFDEKGAPAKGGSVLTLADVYNLKLSADLVTLSGCETALGQEVRGEGVIGLTRGFMYAGARRVMASLWVVNDEATATLMKRFYARLLPKGRGMSPATALKAAQESMTEYHPYYWAGFTLQGEW